MKKIIVLLLSVLLLVAVYGCADEEVSVVNDNGETQEASSSDSKEEQQTEFERTDKIKIGSMVTVVTETREFPEGQRRQPEQGKVFYLVGVELTNEGDEVLSYAPLVYKIEDANGVQQSPRIDLEVPNKFVNGSLAPGGKITGNMVFEVPADMANLKLVKLQGQKQAYKIKL